MKKQEAILIPGVFVNDRWDEFKKELIKEKYRPLILEMIENETEIDHPTEKGGVE